MQSPFAEKVIQINVQNQRVRKRGELTAQTVGFQNLFRRFDLMGLCIAVALALCAGYLIIAGHVLFSVSSGFYFALMLAISRLYYTPQPRELRIY